MHKLALHLELELERGSGEDPASQRADDAMRWWEAAAKLEWAPAQHEIALRSAKGGFGAGAFARANYSAAVEWSSRALAQGYAPAQFTRGNWHRDGAMGVARSEDESLRHWRLAAAQNHAGAQHSLGLALIKRSAAQRRARDGAAAATTAREAADYIRSAALLGNRAAMRTFSSLLAEGEGVEVDTLAARQWKAAAEEKEPA